MLKRLGVERQGRPGRCGARREPGAVGAQHAGRLARAEQTADRARRHGRRAGRRDAGRAARSCRRRSADGMKLTDVIRRPLVTEKTSILREDGRTIVVSRGARTPTRSRSSMPSSSCSARRSRASGRASRTARSSARAASRDGGPTGRRRSSSSAKAKRCRSSWKARRRSWPFAKYNPTSPGQRFQTVQVFDEITIDDAVQAADRAAAQHRRPQQPRRI